jgi:hypothetical protein
MAVDALRDALLWCGSINVAMVVLWAALYFMAPRLLYWPCRWLRLTAEQLDVINYSGMLLFKLGIFLFNVVPYIDKSNANVAALNADISTPNTAGGSNTIILTAPTTSPYVLTAVNNTTSGANGLPVIAANDSLEIVGSGDTIERSTASGTPSLRLLDVAAGASLALGNMTLQGGLASGSGISADGGAIDNQGALTRNGVTVQNNIAQGAPPTRASAGQDAAGGGIYSSASLTLEGSTTVQNNQALGGGSVGLMAVQGRALGGGNGSGGGLYVAGGTVTLTSVTVPTNHAYGGSNAPGAGWPADPLGEGGGLYIATGTTVYIDAFTLANVISNTASTSNPNIFGTYIET